MLFLVKMTVDFSIFIIAEIQTEIFGKKYNINLIFTSWETNTKYWWWWRTNVLSRYGIKKFEEFYNNILGQWFLFIRPEHTKKDMWRENTRNCYQNMLTVITLNVIMLLAYSLFRFATVFTFLLLKYIKCKYNR